VIKIELDPFTGMEQTFPASMKNVL